MTSPNSTDGKFSFYSTTMFAGLLFDGCSLLTFLFFSFFSGGESIYGAKFPGKFQFHDNLRGTDPIPNVIHTLIFPIYQMKTSASSTRVPTTSVWPILDRTPTGEFELCWSFENIGDGQTCTHNFIAGLNSSSPPSRPHGLMENTSSLERSWRARMSLRGLRVLEPTLVSPRERSLLLIPVNCRPSEHLERTTST